MNRDHLALPFFHGQHRYLPALFARDGWQVQLVNVRHAPRQSGRSNYGNLDRALAGILDLAGVAWLIHRRKRARAEVLAEKPIAEAMSARPIPEVTGRNS